MRPMIRIWSFWCHAINQPFHWSRSNQTHWSWLHIPWYWTGGPKLHWSVDSPGSYRAFSGQILYPAIFDPLSWSAESVLLYYPVVDYPMLSSLFASLRIQFHVHAGRWPNKPASKQAALFIPYLFLLRSSDNYHLIPSNPTSLSGWTFFYHSTTFFSSTTSHVKRTDSSGFVFIGERQTRLRENSASSCILILFWASTRPFHFGNTQLEACISIGMASFIGVFSVTLNVVSIESRFTGKGG